jgi:hypothetical protein
MGQTIESFSKRKVTNQVIRCASSEQRDLVARGLVSCELLTNKSKPVCHVLRPGGCSYKELIHECIHIAADDALLFS